MDRLIINNEDLDLYIGTSVNLNLQVADIADISTRYSSFSNTVTVPRTAKNEKLLKMVGTMGNTSRVPYQRTGCNYLKGNIPLITEGYVHLSETNPDNYKLNLFDGLINFSEAMGDKSISDLDLVDLNHNLTEGLYTSSFSNTEGYIYAMGDFGFGQPINTYNIEYQAPSLFVSTVMDRILSQSGFTYEGLPSFAGEVIAPTNGYPISEGSITTTPIGEVSDTFNNTEIDDELTQHVYDHVWAEDISISPDLALVDGNRAIRSNINGRLELEINIDYTSSEADGPIVVRFYKNGITQVSFEVPIYSNGNVGQTIYVPVSIGDEITAKIRGTSTYNLTFYELSVNLTTTVTIASQSGGMYQDFSLMFKEYRQKDFVKDVLQRYGLIPQVKKNHIKFIQMEQLLGDMSNAVDYTDKLTAIRKEGYEPKTYAQQNLFKYKYNRDLLSEDFNGSFTVDNETLDQKKTIVTSVNTISKSLFNKLGLPVYQMILWEEDNESTVVPKKHTNTFYKIKTINSSVSYRLFDSGTTDTFNGVIPFLSYEDVSYQYYLDNYYTRFNWLLDNYKEIEVELNLSPIDIMAVDFFKLVFLKQTGRYYLLDSIRTGMTTTAKLIEITRFN